MISSPPEFRDADLLLRDELSYVCQRLVPLGQRREILKFSVTPW